MLRKPSLKDSAALARARAESFNQLLPWFHQDMASHQQESDPDWQAAKISRYQTDFTARSRLPYLIWEEESLIGFAELLPIWRRGHFRLAYWIRSSMANRGYGTEAVATITRFAFEALGARLVTTGHAAPNTASRKLALKLGFKVYSRHPLACELSDGSLVTGVAYEMQHPDKLPKFQISWH